jgi:hypothetical protein
VAGNDCGAFISEGGVCEEKEEEEGVAAHAERNCQ